MGQTCAGNTVSSGGERGYMSPEMLATLEKHFPGAIKGSEVD